MIGGEVEHGWTGAEGVGALRPLAAPLRGSPGGLLRSGYLTERRLTETGLLFRRIGVSAGLAQTVAAQQEDLGVFDQPVGNRSGDGRIKEDIAPVGKGCV